MVSENTNNDGGVAAFVNWTTEKSSEHPFYGFEPYDGPDGPAPRHTPGGSKFQLACMRSTKYMRMSIAGNQTGKTHARAVEVIIMMTGELPYCFRYKEGEDTGIARAISEDNIKRWGRRSVLTGEIIDHDFNVPDDGTWDCGNIIGVGPFPDEKICKLPGNQQAWICTRKQARDDTWIDLFKDMIPPHCLDKTKGTDGYSLSTCIYYLKDRKSIRLKTYEQGFEKVESKKAWHIVLDEEPPLRSYYTGCVMHAVTLSFSFTPIYGLSWSYTDLYQKWEQGSSDIAVFHASQYDCPYNLTEEVEERERQLEDYERKPKIYGIFAEVEGKPYYDFERCKRFIDEYEAKYALAEIWPLRGAKTVEDAVRVKTVMRPCSSPGVNTWEIYEEPMTGQAYWMPADCAKGSDDPGSAQDRNIAYIFREPRRDEDPEWPVCVASLYTTETTEAFAWLCLYGAIHYNFAMLAPEVKGEDGMAFLVELRDYPFWFKMTVTNDKTKKQTDKIGFDTNARTRTPLFNKQRKYINAHEGASGIPHKSLLFEQSKIIYLRGRPDHPPTSRSDCVVAWSLGLWVFEEARFQIHDNSRWFKDHESQIDFTNLLGLTKRRKHETRPIFGSTKGMDSRSREQWQEKQRDLRKSQKQNQRTPFPKKSQTSGMY